MPRWSDEPVTLDRRDTLHSVKGKLEASGRGRPVVVLSSDCRVADNVLTYRLLARTSAEFGTPIAVVSGNPYWRKLAREHGLRAFASLGALDRARARSTFAFADSLADLLASSLTLSFGKQGWVIIGVFFAMMVGAAYYFLPVMKVTIQTPVQQISQDMVAKVDVGVTSMDVSSSTIPGRVLEHRFTVSDTVSTVGEKKVGKEKARGEATVINTSPSLVMIPAGTILSTSDGQKFATAMAVAVGAYSASGMSGPAPGPLPTGTSTTAGTTTKVPVVAMDAGPRGNVPALAISRFESDTLRALTVFNEQPLSGGTEGVTKVASAEDRGRLKESLFQRAQSQALSELQVRVRQSESLIPHSMQVRVEREDYDRAVDEEADKLKGTLSVVATAISFANADLNTLVEKQWKASIPKGFRAATAGPTIAPPEVTQAGSQTASLKVRATGRAERVVEADDLSQSLRNTSLQDARTKLRQMDALRLVDIEMWPGWASRAFRVEVQTLQ